MSRDKGYRAENELVHFFLDHGIDAKRVPLSGGAPGFRGDILIPELFYAPSEVKCREDNPKRLWEWLVNNDALFLKRNRYPWLVVMVAEDMIALWKRGREG